MNFDHLFDTTIRLWRPSSTDGPQGNAIVTYSQVGATPSAPNAVVNRPSARAGKIGGGVTQIGERVIYMNVAADVQLRDVAEIMAGPDVGYRGEIDGVPTRPRGNHVELRTIVWNGVLPIDP